MNRPIHEFLSLTRLRIVCPKLSRHGHGPELAKATYGTLARALQKKVELVMNPGLKDPDRLNSPTSLPDRKSACSAAVR